jgi:hypothetical protein
LEKKEEKEKAAAAAAAADTRARHKTRGREGSRREEAQHLQQLPLLFSSPQRPAPDPPYPSSMDTR